MNNPQKLPSWLKDPIEFRTHSSLLTKRKEDMDTIKAILDDSAKYFSLSVQSRGDIQRGLMIASIALFFSCFEMSQKRYSLEESIYRENPVIAKQYKKFRKIRNERIAHRGPRKAKYRAMRPADPAMVTNIPIMQAGDASRVPFSITTEEMKEFSSLLEFTVKTLAKELKKYEKAILQESISTSSSASSPARRKRKSGKDKKKKRSR